MSWSIEEAGLKSLLRSMVTVKRGSEVSGMFCVAVEALCMHGACRLGAVCRPACKQLSINCCVSKLQRCEWKADYKAGKV